MGKLFTPQDIIALFGPSEEGMFQRQLPETWAEALDMYLLEYERAHLACREPFPGLLPLLVTLKGRGVRLGIVTGKGTRSAGISARVWGLDRYFDGIEAGSEEGPVKPAGIRAFLTRWAVAPPTVAYVGDAPYDVDAAKEAGVLAVAAAWAASADVEALAARQPHRLYRTVAEFVAWAEDMSQ
jgi:HAD superfamily hydrolase (TIGR01549 family)